MQEWLGGQGAKKEKEEKKPGLHNIQNGGDFYIRDSLPKKIAVLLDFVQMRGGRALPNSFWHNEVQKKWYKLSKLGEVGVGGQGNLDKIQKNSYFFRETVP